MIIYFLGRWLNVITKDRFVLSPMRVQLPLFFYIRFFSFGLILETIVRLYNYHDWIQLRPHLIHCFAFQIHLILYGYSLLHFFIDWVIRGFACIKKVLIWLQINLSSLILWGLINLSKKFMVLISGLYFWSQISYIIPLECRFDYLIFMNSRITETSVVSCKSGNKNFLFFWILFCLLPKFLGTPFAFGNYLLIKAIDRHPSAVLILRTSGEINL